MTAIPAPVTNIADLAAAVRSARTTRGITQGDLAERIGVSRPWISQFESGHTPNAGIDRVLAMINVLGIRLTATGPQGSIDPSPVAAAETVTPPECAPDTSRLPWRTSDMPAPSAYRDLQIPAGTPSETAAFLTELLTPQMEQIADAVDSLSDGDRPTTPEGKHR